MTSNGERTTRLGLWFDCLLLAEIPSGSIELAVPMLGEVIPIGVGGSLPMGRIRICSHCRSVRVHRVDGKPMQVAVLSDTGGRPTQCNVFHQPVSELTLIDIGEYHGVTGRYRPMNRADVANMSNLQRLAETLAAFATAKHRAAIAC